MASGLCAASYKPAHPETAGIRRPHPKDENKLRYDRTLVVCYCRYAERRY